MNSVSLIGRLTRDPEVRYGAASQTAVARFSIAIDRGRDRDGNDRGADYPNIVCFGKTADMKFITEMENAFNGIADMLESHKSTTETALELLKSLKRETKKTII